MSTPREIPAADVVRGMRVRVTQHYNGNYGNTVETIEGEVIACENANLQFGNGAQRFLGYDHPVTVLAEPEPEWVEGAWYWTRAEGQDKDAVRRRLARGWASGGSDSEVHTYTDMHDEVTVLGRVLIIDWPGGDVARDLVTGASVIRRWPDLADQVADAIRTQGGVR